MFKELAPLLSKRSLILTITSVADERIRVTITPRPTGKDDVKELSQPFAVEGTAQELDTELPAAIVSYTAAHMTLENSLAQIKAGMDATLKEVKDEAAKKVAEAKKTNKVGGKVVPPAKVEPVKAPEPPSLFDVAAPAAEPPTPAPVATATESEEADDDEEEEGDQETETPEATVTEIAAAASASDSTPTMFDQAEEEAEIMREAFPEMGGQLIAA
jgi:PRTRC genetic system protein E